MHTAATTSQIAGPSDELHALPVQLEVLRVVATLEDVGDTTVPETALEDRIMRIQLQKHDAHLATTFIAVRPSAPGLLIHGLYARWSTGSRCSG